MTTELGPSSYDKLSTVSVKEAKSSGDFLRQFASFDRVGARSAAPDESELRRFVTLSVVGYLFVAGAGVVILSVLGK